MGILADNLLEAKDNYRCSGVVFLDLRKAFDTVNHQCLLRKFAKCGVVGNVHKWLSNYLLDHWQFVQVGEVKSFRSRCLRGVPQGSKLGPLLFNFYTSDLPLGDLRSSVISYADDTCLSISGNSYNDVLSVLQIDVNLLSAWFRDNLMMLNGKKSKLLLFRKFRDTINRSSLSITVDDVALKPVDSAKYLGVIFDRNLNWRHHLSSAVKKVARKLGVLYRSFKLFNVPGHVAFVRSIIQPDLDYCSSIWNDGSTGISAKLQRIEKRCLRVLDGRRGREPTGDISPILEKYGLSTCKTRHAFYLGSLAHRGFYLLAPREICFRFNKSDISSTYGTRLSASGVILSPLHTEALCRTFFYRVQCFWNSLPSSLRTISNRVVFRYSLRNYICMLD